jgi:Kef-type K+ transport system membrane component KefB
MTTGEAIANQASSSHGLEPMVLVGVAAMLAVAKLSGELFERAGQPPVLGELLGGILVANLSLIGFNGAEFLKTNEIIGALAQLGVIILLFEVGLESNVAEMMEVGWSSLVVAVVARITFGAIVLMVITTTLITPPLLKWSFGRPKVMVDEVMRRQIR